MGKNSHRTYCGVYGCASSSKSNPNLSFFFLPADEERSREWIKLVGREDLLENFKRIKVCALHFKEEHMKNNRLRYNAIPCFHLPSAKTLDQNLFNKASVPPVPSTSNSTSSENKSCLKRTADTQVDFHTKPRTDNPLVDKKYYSVEIQTDKELTSDNGQDTSDTAVLCESVSTQTESDTAYIQNANAKIKSNNVTPQIPEDYICGCGCTPLAQDKSIQTSAELSMNLPRIKSLRDKLHASLRKQSTLQKKMKKLEAKYKLLLKKQSVEDTTENNSEEPPNKKLRKSHDSRNHNDDSDDDEPLGNVPDIFRISSSDCSDSDCDFHGLISSNDSDATANTIIITDVFLEEDPSTSKSENRFGVKGRPNKEVNSISNNNVEVRTKDITTEAMPSTSAVAEPRTEDNTLRKPSNPKPKKNKSKINEREIKITPIEDNNFLTRFQEYQKELLSNRKGSKTDKA